jgi:nitroreductase
MSSEIPKSFVTCIDRQPERSTVITALAQRRSIRAYQNKMPTLETVRAVLDAARWSPSGANIQPWKVIAVAGAERDAVCELARARIVAGANEEGDYPIYPTELREPYRERRNKVAAQRFAALGIDRADGAAREAAILRNYDFFGAPVGLFFITGRELGHSQWAHLGMFIQSVALAAWQLGLGTCAQEAWAKLRSTLHRYFNLPPEDLIYCGMALGYPNPDASVNRISPGRADVDDLALFLGF